MAANAFSLAAVAQLVERVLGKDEVMGPTPISSFVRQANHRCLESVNTPEKERPGR